MISHNNWFKFYSLCMIIHLIFRILLWKSNRTQGPEKKFGGRGCGLMASAGDWGLKKLRAYNSMFMASYLTPCKYLRINELLSFQRLNCLNLFFIGQRLNSHLWFYCFCKCIWLDFLCGLVRDKDIYIYYVKFLKIVAALGMIVLYRVPHRCVACICLVCF